jgi:hypothetical protein
MVDNKRDEHDIEHGHEGDTHLAGNRVAKVRPDMIDASVAVRRKRWLGTVLQNPVILFTVGTIIIAGAYFGLTRVFEVFTLIDLTTGVVAGLIASLGTYAAVQYHLRERRQFGAREWLHFGSAPVWIVPTYFEFERKHYMNMKYYVVPPFDAQAAQFLTQTCRLAGARYPRRKATGSHRLRQKILEHNIITLCLPEWNQYARLFLGLIHEIYVENQSQQAAIAQPNVDRYLADTECTRSYYGLRRIESQDPARSKWHWQIRDFAAGDAWDHQWRTSSINLNPQVNVHLKGRINIDYALIVKTPNPFNPASTVVVACGIHGIGTLGAALFLYKHSEELFSLYPARAQSHLLQIEYAVSEDTNDYLDSEIVHIHHVRYDPLSPRL